MMMGLEERIIHIILGAVIGFVLGYMTAKLHRIEEKVDEVDDIMKQEHGDGGFINKKFSDFMLIGVVLLVAWAAFSSQLQTNDVKDVQKAQTKITVCTQNYLNQTITALNERTTYSRDQSVANVELQRAQAEFITSALQDPPLESKRVEAGLRKYFDKVTAYVTIVGKTSNKQATNPYPTADAFMKCVSGDEE